MQLLADIAREVQCVLDLCSGHHSRWQLVDSLWYFAGLWDWRLEINGQILGRVDDFFLVVVLDLLFTTRALDSILFHLVFMESEVIESQLREIVATLFNFKSQDITLLKSMSDMPAFSTSSCFSEKQTCILQDWGSSEIVLGEVSDDRLRLHHGSEVVQEHFLLAVQ